LFASTHGKLGAVPEWFRFVAAAIYQGGSRTPADFLAWAEAPDFLIDWILTFKSYEAASEASAYDRTKH
jgi:hypothetical protein